ncbi:inositol monophosphatase [Paenibacillus spiritus]|uniref:Inositol-1-monophosphatase n=1 Tax=Paenibacillus spiritus TaxID=2496557 RepID=A0A5J5FUC9_9BACL|nr:inositol monophosphatase family protein [Paenibacillus spiritus]KAA8997145.1 inositol monophosphatase [Paenibacillus spiritus]
MNATNPGGQEREPYIVTGKGYTAVAINAAAKAGEFIKSRQGQIKEVGTKASAQDLVTEVDKGVEQMVRRLVMTHYPHHAFLGEESVEPGTPLADFARREAEKNEYLWVVDPVDGTVNFVHGFPFYCVSIALYIKGELSVGIIYDPIRDEMFVAEKGKGAYRHGIKTRVSAERKLDDSLLAVGFPPDRVHAQPANLAGLQALLPKVRSVRAAGSAALHLAYVAAGRVSGYCEFGLSPWDCAAGVLMVTESGGTVTEISGAPYTIGSRNIAATNGLIHDELLTTLRESGAAGE